MGGSVIVFGVGLLLWVIFLSEVATGVQNVVAAATTTSSLVFQRHFQNSQLNLLNTHVYLTSLRKPNMNYKLNACLAQSEQILAIFNYQ
jgi:hypothetical protein